MNELPESFSSSILIVNTEQISDAILNYYRLLWTCLVVLNVGYKVIWYM